MARPLDVLLVEDCDDDAQLLVRELRRGGFEPRFQRVDRENSLVQALLGQSWDVVISDYSMPDFDGISALKLVRRHAGDLPFLLVSANIGEELAVLAMKAGAQDYIMKQSLIRLVPAVERELREFALRKAHQQAERQMRRLSSAIEQTADLVMITNAEGVIEYVNGSFERTTGYRSADVMGKRPSVLRSGRHDKAFYQSLWSEVRAGRAFQDVFINRKRDGSLYYEEKTISPLKDERGEIHSFIATGKDITDQMRTRERLLHLSQHDLLTGLPNRGLFVDRLGQSLSRARWNKRVVAVAFVDMDRFKTINDTLGYEAGDRILQLVAQRLSGGLRDGDTVARLGDDEFAIAFEDVQSESHVPALVTKIQSGFREPIVIDDNELFVTVTVGVSIFPNDADEAVKLLQNAEVAINHAKDFGTNTHRFYKTEMNARSMYRLTMESALRRALERDEFVLFYQPQVDLNTGRVIAFEALLRWNNPDLGVVTPVEFVPILEDTGMIIDVGAWVLRSACLQLAEWQAQGHEGIHIAVNVSSRQFSDGLFVSRVREELAGCKTMAESIELELTESTIMENATIAIKTMKEFADMGIRLAIDDFGTGYSSLSYLQQFPIHTLKIDRSFVRDVTENPGDAEIAAAIISLAHNLNLKVVAEGVENHGQLDFMRAHQCDYIQGFLIDKPAPAEDAAQWLHRGALEMREILRIRGVPLAAGS